MTHPQYATSFNMPLTIIENTTDMEVALLITNLKSNTASGYDNIPTKLVKQLTNIIAPLFAKEINLWIRDCTFPKFLKRARIKPVFKSGDRLFVNNYRPISILSVFSKIFEKIVFKRLLNHIEHNNIIHRHQYGFTKQSSTLSATLNLIEHIYQSIESKNATSCLFLDLQKAFDCVNHSILIKKLVMYGVSGSAIKLFENYLLDRKQVVHLEQYESRPRIMQCGVPQGSNLGPTLFLIYINDIFNLNLKGHIQLFADDAALVYSSPTYSQLKVDMENDIIILSHWLQNNCMKLNMAKSNYIIFYLKHKPTGAFDELNIDNSIIKRVDSTKYLGLCINSNLTWIDHISKINQKISPFIGVLRRVGYLIPKNLRYSIYYSYIHSHLTYLIQIWGSSSISLISDLQILQNKALKAINCLPLLTPTKSLYNEKLLPLICLIDFEYLMTIYKIRLQLLKCNSHIHTTFSVTERITRNSLNYHLPNYKFSTTQNSVFYKGLNLFNQLDNEKKDIRISEFKSYIKHKLFTNFIKQYNLRHRI